MRISNPPHPLRDKDVVLNSTAYDPQRGIVTEGAVLKIDDWYVNMSPDAIEPLVVPSNFAEKWYLTRAASNGLPRTQLVYGHIGHLGHIVHVSELGPEVAR